MRFLPLLIALLLAADPVQAAPDVFPSSTGNLLVETVAGGLVRPWSLALLPAGRMRVVSRGGHLGLSLGL